MSQLLLPFSGQNNVKAVDATLRWIVGILIAAIVGSYTYTSWTSNTAIAYTDKLEIRWSERMDRFERKLDRLIERNQR